MLFPDSFHNFDNDGDHVKIGDRGYIAKRYQYQDCAIPEYWIIDPESETVLILELMGKFYQDWGLLSGNQKLESPHFSSLNLTVSQLLSKAD